MTREQQIRFMVEAPARHAALAARITALLLKNKVIQVKAQLPDGTDVSAEPLAEKPK